MVVIEVFLFGYFAFCVAYALLFSIGGLFGVKKIENNFEPKNKFSILIPSYKEDNVIVSVAKNALNQNYPSALFDVVIIADSLQPSTLVQLRALPIRVIEVFFEKSTKVKALNEAMLQIGDDYEIGLILDADNVMEPDFLLKINQAYNAGYKNIQGRRVAKNTNTDFAKLDALSEIINNHIYRLGHTALGFSSSLIGSGMAFEYATLKSTMANMDSVGGFDRELEVILIIKGHKPFYLPTAIVYDEKVEKAEVFASQRKRWIASQFIYLRKYFFRGFAGLFKGNLVFFNSAILRNIQLPRVINLGFLLIIVLVSFVISKHLTISPFYWLLLFIGYIISFILAVPLSFYDKAFFNALAKVPQAFIIMTLALFKLKGANAKFIHTPHGVVTMDSATKTANEK